MARSGFPQDICQEEVRDIDIIEIVEPRFDQDWDDVHIPARYGALTDDDVIIGVQSEGQARAYPLSILYAHEIVNDEFVGPLLVTYCPLCKSGVVTERRVNGDPTVFRVSGLLWRPERIRYRAARAGDRVFGVDGVSGETTPTNNGNLVMVDDATRSYWSQILAEGICGPRTGDQLNITPSEVARWSEWKTNHPDTDVLLPPPHSGIADR